MEKMTKTQMFDRIAEVCADYADIVEFCDAEKAKLAAKAEKAKARAAEKKAIGDELYATVVSVLTNEPQSREAVFAQIEGEDLTVAKIRARLSQGVKNEVLVKETVKVDGKNKVHYKKA